MVDFKSLLEPVYSKAWWLSMLSITFGCVVLAVAFCCFISPYNIVPGGVYGVGIVLHNIFPSIQVGTFGYMLDIPLLISAMLVFGREFAGRTLYAALLTPGIMNLLDRFMYPTAEAMKQLDPAQMLGGSIDLTNDLILAAVIGGALAGLGVGIVVRNQATTGGTDIVAMHLHKFLGLKFSNGILVADAVVVSMGLIVIGFGFLQSPEMALEATTASWTLSFYSLISIYMTSRVIAYVIDGASYDKLLFIISDKHHEELKDFIIKDMDRSATYIKARGMYTDADKEMIFIVVSRREVKLVQQAVKQIDPRAFFVVTDAYDTYGEGFKVFPEKESIAVD